MAATHQGAQYLDRIADEELRRRLVVITATGFAYERTDGVAVVPITALGP